MKNRKEKKCRHFNGTINEMCDDKIKYPDVTPLPCFGEGDFECGGYYPLTAEELAAKEAEYERMMDLMRRGLSICCEASIDTRGVITEGKFKNHGPRFCSKCGQLLFMV